MLRIMIKFIIIINPIETKEGSHTHTYTHTHTHLKKPVYESADVTVLHNQGLRTDTEGPGKRPDIVIETKMRKSEN
jgi:hypothetical protein